MNLLKKIFTKKPQVTPRLLKTKSIEEICKYDPKYKNPHRQKELGLGDVTPGNNLLWWGVYELGCLWDTREDDYEELTEDQMKKILVVLWKKINEIKGMEVGLDIVKKVRKDRWKIPRYILESFLTYEEELEYTTNPQLTKVEKEALKIIQEEKDSIGDVIKLVPGPVFQKKAGEFILKERKAYTNSLKVLLSESHRYIGAFPLRTDILEGGKEMNTFIEMMCMLGISFIPASALTGLMGKISNLPILIRTQHKSVRKEQAREFCRYLTSIVNIGDVMGDGKTLRSIQNFEKLIHATYYLKREMLGKTFANKTVKKPLLNTLKMLMTPKSYLSKGSRTVRDMLREKWTSENRLLKVTKRYSHYILPELPWILTQAVKSGRDEPVYDFISYLYELPDVLKEIKESYKIDEPWYSAMESIWNLEYALKVYPPLKNMEPYMWSEVMDAITVLKFKFNEIDTESGRVNYYRFPLLKKSLGMINRYLGKNFNIAKIPNLEDKQSLEIVLPRPRTVVFETFGGKDLKKGTVFMTEGEQVIVYDFKKNPYDEWILAWAPEFPSDISVGLNETYIQVTVKPKEEEHRKFLDGIRGSIPRIVEDNYYFLLFAYHKPTGMLFNSFNPGNTGITFGTDSLKKWKSKNFLKYMAPLLNHPLTGSTNE